MTSVPLLHPVKGRNGYCVPATIAALTGLSTDEVARLVREDDPSIERVRRVVLDTAMEILGKFGTVTRMPASAKTVNALSLSRHYPFGLYYLSLGGYTNGHAVAARHSAEGWVYISNCTGRELRGMALHPKPRKRLKRAFHFKPTGSV